MCIKKTNFQKSFKLKICQFSHIKKISFEFNDITAVDDRCLNPFQYFKAQTVVYSSTHVYICLNETIFLILPAISFHLDDNDC